MLGARGGVVSVCSSCGNGGIEDDEQRPVVGVWECLPTTITLSCAWVAIVQGFASVLRDR